MNKSIIVGLIFGSMASTAFADAFYCTQNNQYISQGMSTAAVKQACGTPANIQQTEQQVKRKVPVMQLTFSVATSTSGQLQGTVTPGLYSSNLQINNGPLTTITVDSTNNQITSININGTSANSVSMCGSSFGLGDPPSAAISSCGSPVAQNNTYKNVNTGQTEPVEIWSYKPTTAQQPFNLVFVNGALAQVDTNAPPQ